MNRLHSFRTVVLLIGERLAAIRRTSGPPSPEELRRAELIELEARYLRDRYFDLDRVWDRQFANALRAGRG